MKRLLVFLVCLVAHCAVVKSFQNELQKAFHHRLATSETKKKDAIEVGMVVLYFNEFPDLKKEIDQEKGVARFILPNVVINSVDAKKMIQSLQSSKNKNYQISIKEIKSPQGLEISIHFDPKNILFKYEHFDAITRQKGLVFHFYNKNLLHAIHQKFNGAAILQTAFVQKPVIVIDPGHGGHDVGAIGISGYKEKDIALAVAQKTADLFKKDGFEVLLTRNNDSFIPLDERTVIAHATKQPSILISLHANHAGKPHTCGIETYYLKQDLFKKDDLQTSIDIVIDSCKKTVCSHSEKLATQLHKTILKQAKKINPDVKDRTVKNAVTQVTIGWVPSVLIEMGFLSNEKEEALLARNDYQMAIAQGIQEGVRNYLK